MIGEKVLVYREQSDGKMGCNWTEGFRIVKRIHDEAYEVSNSGKSIRVNIKHLKREGGEREMS
ncbi:hypothetical protein COBT_000669 [Conglomerata obtusa]